MKSIVDVYKNSMKIVSDRYNRELQKIGIKFYVSTTHVLERSKERSVSLDSCLIMLNKVYKNHLCEMIYAFKKTGIGTVEIRSKDSIVIIARQLRYDSVTWGVVTVLDPNVHNMKSYKNVPVDRYILELK